MCRCRSGSGRQGAPTLAPRAPFGSTWRRLTTGPPACTTPRVQTSSARVTVPRAPRRQRRGQQAPAAQPGRPPLPRLPPARRRLPSAAAAGAASPGSFPAPAGMWPCARAPAPPPPAAFGAPGTRGQGGQGRRSMSSPKHEKKPAAVRSWRAAGEAARCAACVAHAHRAHVHTCRTPLANAWASASLPRPAATPAHQRARSLLPSRPARP